MSCLVGGARVDVVDGGDEGRYGIPGGGLGPAAGAALVVGGRRPDPHTAAGRPRPGVLAEVDMQPGQAGLQPGGGHGGSLPARA